MLLSQQADCVLAASVKEDSTPYRRLVDARIPIVAFDRALPGLAVQSVAADHLAGSQMIAEHMLSLGHRHFAVIGAPQHSPPVQARVQGAGAGRDRASGRSRLKRANGVGASA